MTLARIIRSGLSSTIQDLGRPSLRHFGVPAGGAMDRLSHELANRLVGNAANEATLEMTLTGDEIQWQESCLIAVTGADMAPMVSFGTHTEQALPQHRPVWIPAGSRTQFGHANKGCRCYLAVAGGFDVAAIMSSRSTYLRAGVGGLNGRVTKGGDTIPIGISNSQTLPAAAEGHQVSAPSWFIRTMNLPEQSTTVLRIVCGAHFDRLTNESKSNFLREPFHVSAQSDRMGYRMTGPRMIVEMQDQLESAGIVAGTIQLPPDGNPILLMADCAPTGGYHRIGHVISADIPIAAQLRPGQLVSFQKVGLTEAHELALRQRRTLENALRMVEISSPSRSFFKVSQRS